MKKKNTLRLAVLLFLTAILIYQSSPRLQARVFVLRYGDTIEETLQDGRGLPANLPVQSFNPWEGEHYMLEFILSSRGLIPSSTYYGCYYSPDNVPLAFQNAPVPLTQDGHSLWIWQGEGDNHGLTQKLRDNWYYFQASF